MRAFALYLTVLATLGSLVGCGEESTRPGLEAGLPVGSYIDDPILVERSDPVLLDRIEGDHFIIDMSEAPLVSSGTYNDIIISYWTASSCDEDIHILNSKSQTWEQIGFAIEPGSGLGCRTSPAIQYHLLSARGSLARECVDAIGRIRLRGPIFTHYPNMDPAAEALRVNPDYFAVPLPVRYLSQGFEGLAYDAGSLWASSDSFNEIYNLSYSGEILSVLEPPSGNPAGMAYDGQNMWLADREGTVFKMNRDGNVLCSFSVQVHSATGLAWGGGRVWIGDYGRVTPHYPSKIYGVNPETSCDRGSAVVTTELDVPGGRVNGLAWNGTQLLVASDKLYKVATSGHVGESFAFPVRSVRDIAWDGEAVWILNNGPKDFQARDPVITRFRLR